MARTWASDQQLPVPAISIDRDAGEGPPRCCVIRHVAADALVWWGGHPADLLARARARHPQWAGIPDAALYACGACAETLIREQHVTREEVARGLGLSARVIAHAWMHDEEFLRRGVASAPPEARRQSWWASYAALADRVAAGALPRERFRGEVLKLFQAWSLAGP